jgi:transcriptional antiterminator RfaH
MSWPCVGTEAWFCLRTHPKHEHIAAAQLRQDPEIEVFLPRIRYRRSTRLGPAWVTEALFKTYVFVRFDLSTALRRVQHARAVCGVVHFGDRWPAIPDETIADLKRAIGEEDLRVIEDTLHPGDLVEVAVGPMQGLEAVVTRVMPAKQRVAVLLDFLGRQTAVEMDCGQLTPTQEQSQRARTPLWIGRQEVSSSVV